VFGVIRGMETFVQLISMSSVNSHHYLAENLLPLRVEDEPRFAWRGLLVDTARHFFSVYTLKRVLDGMAAMKLNTFHWHITDSQSYPVQLDSLPKLAEFSVFDSDAIYTKKDITDIVSYANDRGIRVVPEIDMPSHSASFGLAYPELTI
jgi:hexosaminidase